MGREVQRIAGGRTGQGGVLTAPALLWARDTWRSIDAAVCPGTGLPGDSIGTDLTGADPRTSPTNAAALLWSTVAASDLGLISARDGAARCAATLGALERLNRHLGSGLFFNWYDASSGRMLHPDGHRTQGFVSSVDNGWLAASLRLVAAAAPTLSDRCCSLMADLDLTVFESPGDEPGPLHGGFWIRRTRRPTIPSRPLRDGSVVQLTPHRYDIANSETRIIEYAAVAGGQRDTGVLARLRAPRRAYLGHDVAASWGGSMFEALSPSVLVPEASWAPESWGRNHRATAEAHRAHARRLGSDVWGFSPALRPDRGYAEYGVPGIAAGPGYPSTWRGRPVVTAHAAALALDYLPGAAAECLAALQTLPGVYGRGGFADSVQIGGRGRVAGRHLVLDQAMLLAGVANYLTDGALRRGFHDREDVAEAARAALRATPKPSAGGWTS